MVKIILNNFVSLISNLANYRDIMKIKINFLTNRNSFFHKYINTSLHSICVILFTSFATLTTLGCSTGGGGGDTGGGGGGVTCTAPQTIQNGVCVTPVTSCLPPQISQNGVCVTPQSGSFALAWEKGFSSSLTVTVFQSITAIATVSDGTLASCTATSVPQGLKFEKVGTTCQLSGNFTQAKELTTYTFMASSTEGKSANANLNITVKCLNNAALVDGVCPFGFSYPQANYVWATNTNVNIPVPNVIGKVASYSISPKLPAWLSLNTVSGAISGKTPFAFSSVNYTVTAKSADSSTVTVNLGINVVPIVDIDGDGLIEITNIEQLNDVRWSISRSIAWRTSNSDSGITLGCPRGVCRGYELANNIDFTGSRWASNCIGANCVAGGWDPIGSEATPFTASFEGNSYVIQNLYINRNVQYLGLFSYVSENASISNLGLTNMAVSGQGPDYFYAGGLTGSSLGIITNSYTTGLVLVSGRNGSIGGLVGNNGGVISGSYAAGLVTASGINGFDNRVGGLVGSGDGTISDSYATSLVLVLLNDNSNVNSGGLVGFQSGGTIRNNYATGWLTLIGGASGTNYVGGLVGYQLRGVSITNNYATGWVTVSGGSNSTNHAGGLVGLQDFYSNISNSYAMGRVVASGKTGSTNKVGGLVAIAYATIKNCYATGWVTASGGLNNFTGGFLGDHDILNMNTRILNSYWDNQSAGVGRTCGNNPGLCAGAMALTTAQMQATSGTFLTNPSGLGSCFQLNPNKYPKLYTWNASLPIPACTRTLLGGENATR